MADLARDRNTIGSLARQHLRPDRRGRRPAPPGPALVKADVAKLRQLMTMLNKPENQAALDELLDRLPRCR